MNLLLFLDNDNDAHDPGAGMPDRPARTKVCKTALDEAGIRFELRRPAAASPQDLQAAHDRGYLARLETFCSRGGGWIDADTPAGPHSFEVATRAAGACCEAVDAVSEGAGRAFCLIRPPGHHATRDQAMGFCLVNNVAVGAAHALARGLDRIIILDIDVHHGNGTQDIFWANPHVLYLSLHQWPWYPWTSGELEEIGNAEGEGFNVNVPLPEGCGDEVYEAALARIVAPIARDYRPELVIVSAGFDAHDADALSLQRVTAAGFGRMTETITALADELCEGRLVMALEGGYNLDALAQSVTETVKAMTSDISARSSPPVREVTPETDALLDPFVAFHSSRWRMD